MAELTGCLACGGVVAPDGCCWDCGATQPAFRAHLEVATDGGAAGVSDRGLRRGVNADAMALAAKGPWTVGVVCDGVSMSPRPERAARLAADTGLATTLARLVAGGLPEAALVDGALHAAHTVAALAASVRAAPACTYVAGAVSVDGIWTTWVGDSRAYWLPDNGSGMALTEDDTDSHEVLTAWLGADAGAPTPQVRSYRPRRSGQLLLCTDGLWRHLPEAETLRARLARRSHTSPVPRSPLEDARALVDHALDAGGPDNVTAVVIPAGDQLPATE